MDEIERLNDLVVSTEKSLRSLPGYDSIPPLESSLFNLPFQYSIFTIPKEISSEVIKISFDTLEDKASWVILRKISNCENPDDCISNYSRESRIDLFIKELYKNPEKHDIFNEREKAIKYLASLDIILKKNYSA